MSIWSRFKAWLRGWPEPKTKTEELIKRTEVHERSKAKKPKGLNPKKKKKQSKKQARKQGNMQ